MKAGYCIAFISALSMGFGQSIYAQSSMGMDCPGHGVCRESRTGLPLRLLPRPFSNIYGSKDDGQGNIVRANVRAFYPLYVFAREELNATVANDPKGWYRVGTSAQGEPLGWMRAKDVLEWRQALIVAYIHPGVGNEARGRVLMFDDMSRLSAMVESPDRAEQFGAAYALLKQQKIPEGVVSKEPERFVDIEERFYMLPIVDFQRINIDGDEARYLQLAAAVPGERSQTDTLTNPSFRKQATEEAGGLQDVERLKGMAIDLVFVMDMTGSMQPFINQTKEMIAEIARTSSASVGERIRFGLVGYRDDTDTLPHLGFISKNFTPTLVGAEQLAQILSTQAKAATEGAGDYAEEVFAGMETALGMQWDVKALRLIILVGDASSHPPGHEQNTTGLDERTLRILADKAQAHVLALHLREARAASDHPLASKQFGTLSKVRGGTGESALTEISVEDKVAFARTLKLVADQVVARIEQIARQLKAGTPSETAKGDAGPAASASAATQLAGAPANGQPLLDMPTTTTVASAQSDDPAVQAARQMNKLIDTALVEYLGKGQTPPRDLLVWAFDRDPLNPATHALEVRVLLTKAQLSDLVTKLELVSQAMKQANLTQMAFFEALSSVAAGTIKNPEQIRNADKLKGAGLLDAFIESLPYKSEILSLSNELYAAMTPTERGALQEGLDSKLMLYRAVNENVDGWVQLNDGDADAEKVYPLRLEALP